MSHAPSITGPLYPEQPTRAETLDEVYVGPTTDIIDSAALRRFGHVNSLYVEPFFSCRQGGGSPPPAATGSPSPIRAVGEQFMSLVRPTGRRSSVPLASRPSGNRFGRFQTNVGPEAFPDGLLSRWSNLSRSCHLRLCECGKLRRDGQLISAGFA